MISSTKSDTEGIFHAKMGTIKDRNGMNLTEDNKERWQEYTELLKKKKVLMSQITMMMWSLTESQTNLECEVKCTLGRIMVNKTNGD